MKVLVCIKQILAPELVELSGRPEIKAGDEDPCPLTMPSPDDDSYRFNPSDEYIEYEAAKKAVVVEYAKKDEHGNPEEVKDGVFRMEREDAETAQKKIAGLDAEYKKVIEERTKDIIAFDQKLEEKITIEMEILKFESIPDNVDDDLMAVLFPIICKD